MIGRTRVAIVLVALGSFAGVAAAKPKAPAKAPAKAPIDGTWQAHGKVTVARHIQDVKVGDTTTRTWMIKTTCGAKASSCKTALSYHTSKGHQITVPLKGKGGNWNGTLERQTFDCTNGGTATGSLAFKLHVTGFVKHHGKRVAKAMSARGIQTGTGCAVVKEIVAFTVSREQF
jgi:hypothetical protein